MKPVDYIVLLLTVPIATVIIVATIAPVFTERMLSESKASLLAELLDQMIAVILVYVGFKLRGTKN